MQNASQEKFDAAVIQVLSSFASSPIPKLVEIANGIEAAQDGRIYIERVNAPFLEAGGGDDFRAGIERAITLGWLRRHESGTYVKFTDDGGVLSLKHARSVFDHPSVETRFARGRPSVAPVS